MASWHWNHRYRDFRWDWKVLACCSLWCVESCDEYKAYSLRLENVEDVLFVEYEGSLWLPGLKMIMI